MVTVAGGGEGAPAASRMLSEVGVLAVEQQRRFGLNTSGTSSGRFGLASTPVSMVSSLLPLDETGSSHSSGTLGSAMGTRVPSLTAKRTHAAPEASWRTHSAGRVPDTATFRRQGRLKMARRGRALDGLLDKAISSGQIARPLEFAKASWRHGVITHTALPPRRNHRCGSAGRTCLEMSSVRRAVHHDISCPQHPLWFAPVAAGSVAIVPHRAPSNRSSRAISSRPSRDPSQVSGTVQQQCVRYGTLDGEPIRESETAPTTFPHRHKEVP